MPPKPFARPGISLERTEKTWQTVPVTHIRCGDILADKGLVRTIVATRGFENSVTLICGVDETQYTFAHHATITAFTEGKPSE